MRSLVRVPYKSFVGKQLVVRGFKHRGLYKVEILERANVEGESKTDKRYMKVRVLESYRSSVGVVAGQSALVPIQHSIKEVQKVLVPL